MSDSKEENMVRIYLLKKAIKLFGLDRNLILAQDSAFTSGC